MIVDPASLVTVMVKLTSIHLCVQWDSRGRPRAARSVAKASQCLDLLFVVELIVIAGGYACRVLVFKLIVTDCLLPVAPVYIHMLLAVLSSCVCVCVCVCVYVK